LVIQVLLAKLLGNEFRANYFYTLPQEIDQFSLLIRLGGAASSSVRCETNL
jgi:hypothetical protein